MGLRFSNDDIQWIERSGNEFKKRTTVKGIRIDADGIVETHEGIMPIDSGSYLFTDGHRVWPIDPDYLKRNYDVVIK